jgi:hypothetical protein
MKLLGDIFYSAVWTFIIIAIYTAAFANVGRIHTQHQLKAPPPMTLEETQRFFSTFKLEAGQ